MSIPFVRIALLAACLVVAPSTLTAEAREGTSDLPLRFTIAEGRVTNEFFRSGPVAAHLVLTSGPAPRLVVAFPAGNSGVAMWFDSQSSSALWQPGVQVAAAERELPDGTLRGVTAEVGLTGGPISVRHAILSSVRVIRDYGYTGRTPGEVAIDPQVTDGAVVWQRRRLDGAAGYYLSVEVLTGRLMGSDEGPITFAPGPAGDLRLRITALTGDPPLTPLDEERLLADGARADAQLRQTLAFLSYEEKLLAGSWRFNTYFGRDTLMSLLLLMPVLEPPVVEAGLGSVLARLGRAGEVAHEEDIGEYAVLRHLQGSSARLRRATPAERHAASAAPVYDYKMIDDDFLLPVVASRYLLDASASGAAKFLARRNVLSERHGDALLRNFRYVVSEAEAFADDPDWHNLVSLKPGANVGNWRDSEDGLGGGRIPYDVNGVFMPAALFAIARLRDSGLLEDFLQPADEGIFSRTTTMADTWMQHAPPKFTVSITPQAAAAAVQRYARRVGVDPAPALAAMQEEPVEFKAVALDGQGRPVPVMNTDEAFALLFLQPPGTDVERSVAALMRPFPAGLLTAVGPVVANPVYAGEDLQPLFGRARYHGTVIWSWQQAMLAAGMLRQLERNDLGESARAALKNAQESLHSAMAAAHTVRGSELWSWSQEHGSYRIEPFGQRQEDETESNAAQLWSTVYLALPVSTIGSRRYDGRSRE